MYTLQLKSSVLAITAAFMICGTLVIASPAQTTMASFNGANGAGPLPLIQVADGKTTSAASCAACALRGGDAKPAGEAEALTTVKQADQLYAQGKFQEAAAKYEAALKVSGNLEVAQAGLTVAQLHAGKTDQALQTVIAALGAHPDSARLMATLGKVTFRRGEMAEAEQAFQAALQIDGKNVDAYVGLARLYEAISMHATSYAALKRAHDLDAKDPEAQLLWLQTLPRNERLPALQAYLAGPHLQTAGQNSLQQYEDYLQKTRNDPPHNCKLMNNTEHVDIKLAYVHDPQLVEGMGTLGPMLISNMQHIAAVGLELKVNDHPHLLMLDTGASGINIDRKAANRAGLKRISDVQYSGIGDQGARTGYLALADRIKIGPLEFHDCVVTVTDRNTTSESDAVGLIGADVFASYLVDIDVPQMVVRLSSLPKRPGDAKTTVTLNTQGESPDFYEGADGAEATGKEAYQPKDRYVSPEMTTWTRVFRFGHLLLVPARLNASKQMLFLIDTGAFANTLTMTAARSIGKMDASSLGVEGVSGKVNDVYRTEKVDLEFARFHQQNINTVTFDLSGTSDAVGTEVSGALGIDLLSMLEIKIDYRDGLVDFVYRDRHGVTH
jgi:tetratricopeptide (TPR) repeat protein